MLDAEIIRNQLFNDIKRYLWKVTALESATRTKSDQLHKLAAERKRFQDLLDQSFYSILIIDITGKVIACNQTACRYLQYSHEELLNLELKDIEVGIDQKMRESIARNIIPGNPVTGIGVHRRKDGSTFRIEVCGDAIEIVGMRYVLSLSHDITDKSIAKQVLQTRETQLRNMFRYMPLPAAQCDLLFSDNGAPIDYLIVDANPAFQKTVKPDGRTYIGQKASEAFGIQPAPYLYRLTKVVRTGKPLYFEFYYEPLKAYFSINAFAFGEKQFGAVFQDITEQKEKEALLRKRGATEELLNRLSARFIAEGLDKEKQWIDYVLQNLGEALNIDNLLIFLITSDNYNVTLAHKWFGPGIGPVAEENSIFPIDRFPWFRQQLAERRTIMISSIENLPEEAKEERQFISIMEEGTYCLLPIFYNDDFFGAMLLQSRRGKDLCTEGDKRLIQKVADLLGNAIEQQRRAQALQLTQKSIDQLGDSIFWLDDRSRIIYVNEAACISLGYTKDELLHKTILDIDPNFNRDNWWKHWAETKKAISRTIETSHRHRDGHLFPVEVTIDYLEFGGKEYHSAIARNISDRKKAEAVQAQHYQDIEFLSRTALGFIELPLDANFYKHLGEQLHQLVGNAYVIINSFNSRTKTARTESIHGLGPIVKTVHDMMGGRIIGRSYKFSDEVIQLLLDGKLHPAPGGLHEVSFGEIPKALGNLIERVANIGEIYGQGFTYKGQLFGNAMIFMFRGSHMQNQNVIEAYINQASIALQRHIAEYESHESEKRFKQLYNNVFDALVMSAEDGTIVDLNEVACRLTGYQRHELLYKHFTTITAPGEIPRLQAASRRALDNGSDYMGKTALRSKEGKLIPVEAGGVRIDMDGKYYILGSFRDISEREIAEQERLHLEQQLHQSQKLEAIGRLAGGVAHDFNNLLTGILGYTEMILNNLSENDPLTGEVREIKKAADRASALTRQLLTFSRKQIISPKLINLNELLTNDQKMLSHIVGGNIKISFDLEQHLEMIKIDPGQIEQVLLNIVINARDAMPNGGKLVLSTKNCLLLERQRCDHLGIRHGQYVICSITDNGIGMTDEVREKIFEPFFTTKEKGTGLGLATVYGIITQNKGAIEVESSPQIGTTFHLYLPVTDSKELLEPTVMNNILPVGSETILLAEDEEMVRSLAAKVLTGQGYRILQAADGTEALALYQKYGDEIDMLLSDVIMPNMTGKELADRLLEINPTMKILFMSGYTEDTLGKHGVLEMGINYLQKPFTLEGLTIKIREVLDRKS